MEGMFLRNNKRALHDFMKITEKILYNTFRYWVDMPRMPIVFTSMLVEIDSVGTRWANRGIQFPQETLGKRRFSHTSLTNEHQVYFVVFLGALL